MDEEPEPKPWPKPRPKLCGPEAPEDGPPEEAPAKPSTAPKLWVASTPRPESMPCEEPEDRPAPCIAPGREGSSSAGADTPNLPESLVANRPESPVANRPESLVENRPESLEASQPEPPTGAAAAAMPPAKAPDWPNGIAGWVTPTSVSGSSTIAVRPPPSCGRSCTRMPWRRARRPTTKRPMRRDTDTSTTGGFDSRQFAWASSSAVMPMPWSVMPIITPPPSMRLAVTVTLVSREEKEIAFSISSASRWMTSLTAWPATATPGSTCMSTRS